MSIQASLRKASTPALATIGLLLLAPSIGCARSPTREGDPAVLAPAPAFSPVTPAHEEIAVLSGGCFWGLQGVFQHVRGVTQVQAGYAGGTKATADYETVSTGTTGHAESVRIVFDPRQISYATLLRIYFSVATDPTQLNRQFPDEGPQYRGEIFYLTPTQEAIAAKYITQLKADHIFSAPIVTRIDPYVGFYRAEDYHQDYLLKHPDAPYIATYDLPKVRSLKALFPQRYRAEPVGS